MAADPPDRPDPSRILSAQEIQHHLRHGGPGAVAWIARHWGSLSARLGMLSNAVEDRLAQPAVRNYPPLAFIAYKWDTPAHNAWVARLSAYLTGRGWAVLLDQDHLEADASNFNEVPAYIARMVGCDRFVALVTDRYLQFVEERTGQTTWVFDEYELASRLHMAGRLQIVPVWLQTSAPPTKPLLSVGAIDLRDDPERFEALDEAFPVYGGPRLDDTQQRALLAFTQAFDAAAAERDAGPMVDLLVGHDAFSALYEFALRHARLRWMAGEAEQAAQLAATLCDECEDGDEAMELAQMLDAGGDHPRLFRLLYRMRWKHRLMRSPPYHYFVGETLRERNSVFAALNHLRWLRQLLGPRAAEGPAARLAAQVDEAIAELAETCASVTADHRFGCTVCPALYVFGDGFGQVCGECATLYDATDERCPVCDNDGTVPLQRLLPGGDRLPPDREIEFAVAGRAPAPGAPVRFAIQCPVCNEGAMRLLPARAG